MITSAAALAVAPELSSSGTAANIAPPTTREQIHARAARSDYEQWLAQVEPVGGCIRPVRLRGQLVDVDTATGEVIRQVDTGAELPDGVIYKACGSRRASQCPSCAETYRRDAYFLLHAGVAGGVGAPETVRPREAAIVLGISSTKMYELIIRREVVSVKIGGCRRIPVEALRAYVAALVEDAA